MQQQMQSCQQNSTLHFNKQGPKNIHEIRNCFWKVYLIIQREPCKSMHALSFYAPIKYQTSRYLIKTYGTNQHKVVSSCEVKRKGWIVKKKKNHFLVKYPKSVACICIASFCFKHSQLYKNVWLVEAKHSTSLTCISYMWEETSLFIFLFVEFWKLRLSFLQIYNYVAPWVFFFQTKTQKTLKFVVFQHKNFSNVPQLWFCHTIKWSVFIARLWKLALRKSSPFSMRIDYEYLRFRRTFFIVSITWTAAAPSHFSLTCIRSPLPVTAAFFFYR